MGKAISLVKPSECICPCCNGPYSEAFGCDCQGERDSFDDALEDAVDGDLEAMEVARTEGHYDGIAFDVKCLDCGSSYTQTVDRNKPWCCGACGSRQVDVRFENEPTADAPDTMTPAQAVKAITECLSFHEGQVWTREMAEERARNLVCWLQYTRIEEEGT